MTPPKTIRNNRHHLVEDATGRASFQTYAGQAHFAGTGPAGKTCRECLFWVPAPGLSKHAYGNGIGRELKPCRCQRRMQLVGGVGKEVPHDARACRHFEPSDNPPTILGPRGRR